MPAGELSSPYGRPTARPEGRADPDGVSTFRTLKQRPGWVPSISRGRRCSSRPTTIIGLRLSHLSDPSLRPATTTHLSEALLHETSTKGSSDFTRPVFPSPVAPGWSGSPWAFPRASHPAITRSARRGGDRPSSTSLKHAFTASAEPPNSRVYLIRATSCRTRGSRRLVLPDQSAQFPQEQHRLTAPWRLLLAGRCGTEAGVRLGRRRLLSGKAWQAGASREVNVPVEEKVPLVVLLVRVAPLSSWLTGLGQRPAARGAAASFPGLPPPYRDGETAAIGARGF